MTDSSEYLSVDTPSLSQVGKAAEELAARLNAAFKSFSEHVETIPWPFASDTASLAAMFNSTLGEMASVTGAGVELLSQIGSGTESLIAALSAAERANTKIPVDPLGTGARSSMHEE